MCYINMQSKANTVLNITDVSPLLSNDLGSSIDYECI